MQLCFDNAGHFAVPASVQFEAGARLSPPPPHSTASLYHSCLMDMNLIPITKHGKPKEIESCGKREKPSVTAPDDGWCSHASSHGPGSPAYPFFITASMHQSCSFQYQTHTLPQIRENCRFSPSYLASCDCHQLFERHPPFIHMLDSSLRSYTQKSFHLHRSQDKWAKYLAHKDVILYTYSICQARIQ